MLIKKTQYNLITPATVHMQNCSASMLKDDFCERQSRILMYRYLHKHKHSDKDKYFKFRPFADKRCHKHSQIFKINA